MKERLITLAMALLALGLSLFLLSPPQPPQPKQSAPTSEDRGKAGLKGAAEWLRRQGVAVAGLRNRYDRLPLVAGPGSDNLLIVSLPPDKAVEQNEWASLQAWLEDGNSLLVLGAALWQPDWSNREACLCDVNSFLENFAWSLSQHELDPEQPQPGSDRQSFRDKIAAMQAEIQAQLPVEDRLLPVAGQPLADGITQLSTRVVPRQLQTVWSLETEHAGNIAMNLLLRSDGQGVALWQLNAGAGQIFLSLAPDLFSNERLALADNARLLANLVNQALAGDGKVIFDDYHFGLSELYDPERFFRDNRLHQTLAWLGLMWLLYVAGHSNRLAPVRPRLLKLSMRDLVDVTATFFARRIPDSAVAEELLRQLLLDIRLARRLPDDDHAWHWLEQHPQIPRLDLTALRRGRRIPLTRLTEIIRQIRNTAL
ncbi:MAG: DUF4350 domain-containing protein [Methylococcaceae bacterium]|nr:DUF4350 domain-containing protein [Methylococcaceae bacterium]